MLAFRGLRSAASALARRVSSSSSSASSPSFASSSSKPTSAGDGGTDKSKGTGSGKAKGKGLGSGGCEDDVERACLLPSGRGRDDDAAASGRERGRGGAREVWDLGFFIGLLVSLLSMLVFSAVVDETTLAHLLAGPAGDAKALLLQHGNDAVVLPGRRAGAGADTATAMPGRIFSMAPDVQYVSSSQYVYHSPAGRVVGAHFMTYADKFFARFARGTLHVHHEFFNTAIWLTPDAIENAEYKAYLDYIKSQVPKHWAQARGHDLFYDWKVKHTGAFFWKPVLILQRLQKLKDGEFLLYMDTRSRLKDTTVVDQIITRLTENENMESPTHFPVMCHLEPYEQERVSLPATYHWWPKQDNRKARRFWQCSTHYVAMINTRAVRAWLQSWINTMRRGNSAMFMDNTFPFDYIKRYIGSRPDQVTMTMTLTETGLPFLHTAVDELIWHHSRVPCNDLDSPIHPPGQDFRPTRAAYNAARKAARDPRAYMAEEMQRASREVEDQKKKFIEKWADMDLAKNTATPP